MLNFNDFKIFHLFSVDSTNNFAISHLISNPSNFVVIADQQTAGKTTKSNLDWKSPLGNLYFSFVLKIPSSLLAHFQLISFLSSLSILQVVKDLSPLVDVKIKWPNDVLLNSKKLSGILIEKYLDFAIIGIGVNISSFPSLDSKFPPTSLSNEGINISKEDFSFLLINKIISNFNLVFENDFSIIIKQILPFMFRFNMPISLSFNGKIYNGIFSNIENNGAITIFNGKDTFSFLSAQFLN